MHLRFLIGGEGVAFNARPVIINRTFGQPEADRSLNRRPLALVCICQDTHGVLRLPSLEMWGGGGGAWGRTRYRKDRQTERERERELLEVELIVCSPLSRKQGEGEKTNNQTNKQTARADRVIALPVITIVIDV